LIAAGVEGVEPADVLCRVLEGEARVAQLDEFVPFVVACLGHGIKPPFRQRVSFVLLMHSEGADRMTKAEIEELGDLLSDMGEARDSEVIGSHPKGNQDCDEYLRARATSLALAADSTHGFNMTADMEYLRDYRRLVAMYLRAAADAQWCVSDHLYRAYP
jgi:hypothetical protein